MSPLRLLMSVIVGSLMFSACAAESEPPAAPVVVEVNPVTGEGLTNPNPTRIGNWATLPEGREWGSTAGLDIDPTDGHVWGYERCGSGSAGGPGVNCDNNPVDPIFKFDRHTGEVLTSFFCPWTRQIQLQKSLRRKLDRQQQAAKRQRAALQGDDQMGIIRNFQNSIGKLKLSKNVC